MTINFKKLNPRATAPTYGSLLAGGADLRVITDTPIIIPPHKTEFCHTGIAAAFPEGWVGVVAARSGLACKMDLAPANKIGIIDADYTGEIMVALHNHGETPRRIEDGDRIAQLLIMPAPQVTFVEVDELEATERGEGGFGSTGNK